MKNFFNPKVKEMFEENPDQSVIGLFWAMNWRFQLILISIYVGILIIASVISALIIR